jgi:hypothetical protein
MSAAFDFTPEEMDERARHLAAMERNSLMRNSGVMDDTQLNEFLESSQVTGTSDAAQFIGFDVAFGFDDLGRDFVVIKDRAAAGTHIVLVAPQRVRLSCKN